MAEPQVPHFLYKCWATNSRLLYVGMTSNLNARMRAHSEKGWFEGVGWVETKEYPDRTSCAEAERDAICSEKPAHNKVYNGGNETTDAPRRRSKPPTSLPSRELMSIAQAAVYFGVNPRTIRRRIAEGALTAYRMGPRLIRVDRGELDLMMRPIPTAGCV